MDMIRKKVLNKKDLFWIHQEDWLLTEQESFSKFD